MSRTTPAFFYFSMLLILLFFAVQGCQQSHGQSTAEHSSAQADPEKPDYFLLRPSVEKAFGYSHAVKIGNTIKISGAVSMDAEGKPTAVGDMAQQIKNCYSDLEKILQHYGCTFDDVVVEDIFTTDMAAFFQHAGYRNEVYQNHFPTGTWLEVKGLAMPEFLIEIEMEVYKTGG
ncbi:MAG: RidA family protein, partial [Bacteroidota bacterium]